jgi:hypothetical protein
MRPSRWRSFPLLISLLLSALAWSQPSASLNETRLKVCVAAVNNRSAKSLYVERMTDRLAHSLTDSKVNGIVLESTTTSDRDLHPTLQNSEELKARDCDYLVLTQVVDPKSHTTEVGIPPISIGGRAPSVDASDPMGGHLDRRLETASKSISRSSAQDPQRRF